MCFLQKNCNEKGWARKKYSIKRRKRGFHKNEALARGSHSTMRIKILPRSIQKKGKFYPSSKKNHKKNLCSQTSLLGSLYKSHCSPPPQKKKLADHLTLFQPWGGGADSAHPLLVAPPMLFAFRHHL